jgi:hypothetical protein
MARSRIIAAIFVIVAAYVGLAALRFRAAHGPEATQHARKTLQVAFLPVT